MPHFEIIYSDAPMSKALSTDSILARSRIDAAQKAAAGLRSAQSRYGARCYRVVDGQGMVVSRGPVGVSKPGD